MCSIKAPIARRKAWTTMSILSMGEGIMILVRNIIVPRAVAMVILFVCDLKVSSIPWNVGVKCILIYVMIRICEDLWTQHRFLTFF